MKVFLISTKEVLLRVMIPVAAVKCKDYSPEIIDSALDRALDLIGGIKDLIKPNMKVLLKVNLLMAIPPEIGVTTHPGFVIAVVKYIKKLGAEVWVGDSSSWNTSKALKVTGVQDAAESAGAKIMNFNEFTPKKIKMPEGSVLDEVALAQPLFDADLIISLPKLKSHELTGFSGAVKNSFGMVVGQNKGEVHRKLPKLQDFAKGVLDIFALKTPSLFIMDGITCVEGTAAKGNPKNIGVLLASKNAFALDTVAETIIGFKPENLPIPSEAIARGIPGNTLSEIQILGDSLESLKVEYHPPNTVSSKMMKKLHGWFMGLTKQKVNPEICIKCGVCAKCCPVQAITLAPYPTFNFDKCIHCWCCSEVCNQGAITLKVPWSAKLFGFN